jgi:MauM/NapG family ferredoxin protein
MKITSSRISQLIFLAVFIVLFVNTEYRGKDEISAAINSFFRANPLVAISYILSTKTITMLIFPGILMLIFSLLLGRFFCGWICPLGTTIDLITNKIKKKALPLKFLKTTLKYYLLFTLLFTALFNINIAGILDPIAILVRALTFFFYPLFGHIVKSGWAGLYSAIGDRRDHVDFIYAFLRDYLLPFRDTLYPLAFVSLLFFALIIFLERYEKRNWCRNLCPLGTLLGLLSRFSLFRRLPGTLCADCRECKNICPTAFEQDVLQQEDCILCMDCKLKCNFKRVKFLSVFSRKGTKKKLPVVIGRRVFMGSVLSGFLLAKTFAFQPPQEKQSLLRPPGADKESEFLKKCVRCGECMKVCLRSALYPDLFKSGLYGIFTPVFIPRLGYCEYNCNLCGQVCPTGAIPNLPLDEKKKSVIGLAVIDKDICLPYAKKINCIVCEEHCPVPGKAIKFELIEERDYSGKMVKLKKPYIKDDLCTGCGICENKCPLEGKSAIEVFANIKNRVF